MLTSKRIRLYNLISINKQANLKEKKMAQLLFFFFQGPKHTQPSIFDKIPNGPPSCNYTIIIGYRLAQLKTKKIPEAPSYSYYISDILS